MCCPFPVQLYEAFDILFVCEQQSCIDSCDKSLGTGQWHCHYPQLRLDSISLYLEATKKHALLHKCRLWLSPLLSLYTNQWRALLITVCEEVTVFYDFCLRSVDERHSRPAVLTRPQTRAWMNGKYLSNAFHASVTLTMSFLSRNTKHVTLLVCNVFFKCNTYISPRDNENANHNNSVLRTSSWRIPITVTHPDRIKQQMLHVSLLCLMAVLCLKCN